MTSRTRPNPDHARPDAVAKALADVRETHDGFELSPGFRASAVCCGLKESGALDLALVATERSASAAGVFTTNRVQAAPVLWDLETLRRNPHRIRAVIANSGCANACTGEPGLDDARRMAAQTAEALGCAADQVLVLSTGVIGRRLDMAKLEPGIVRLAQAAPDAAAAARAILTTDTRPKHAALDASLSDGAVRIRGFAKGAGMIHPDMATMLAIVTTDAIVPAEVLSVVLRAAVALSFNRISVDGDMSTNDTVLLLASGASGVTPHGSGDLETFERALTAVCVSLAKQIARDGEGATRLVEVVVSGGRLESEAHAVADRIACSPLVKSAVHGGDPNWGRVLAAAGAASVELDPDRVSLAFGPPGNEVRLVERGLPTNFDPAPASRALLGDPARIHLDLGLGDATATVWTCDLSAEYVAINAHYTT